MLLKENCIFLYLFFFLFLWCTWPSISGEIKRIPFVILVAVYTCILRAQSGLSGSALQSLSKQLPHTVQRAPTSGRHLLVSGHSSFTSTSLHRHELGMFFIMSCSSLFDSVSCCVLGAWWGCGSRWLFCLCAWMSCWKCSCAPVFLLVIIGFF